jgi:hypothetical protein
MESPVRIESFCNILNPKLAVSCKFRLTNGILVASLYTEFRAVRGSQERSVIFIGGTPRLDISKNRDYAHEKFGRRSALTDTFTIG